MTSPPGYQTGARIYESSHSIVFRATRLKDNKPVVFKVLNREYPTPAELERFHDEFLLTRSLKNPGVIQVYDCVKYNHSRALILEDFGGKSLEEIMHKRVFCAKEVARLAFSLGNALAYIHDQNIIHKDLTPANILYNEDTSEVKIIDFGIASRMAVENTELTSPANLEGTLRYLSPEQTGRMNRLVDYRSDFYTLGATFYHLLAGEPPFLSNDPMELVHCHLARSPKPLHEHKHAVPLALSRIVAKLMEKNAEERYRGAWGMVEDLQMLLIGAEKGKWLKDFRPGLNDRFPTLQVPEKLYGREIEVGQLMAAFEEVRQGARQMVLVEGLAGIGKSALVREIYKPITEARGYFAWGKCEQFRKTPHGAISEAMRQLFRQILAEGEVKLEAWKKSLNENLEGQGAILEQMIPELGMILGKVGTVSSQGAQESAMLFRRAFCRLMRCFCSKDHPMVMFMDDLQWADLLSLELIDELLRDEKLKHFLFIGAYRTNEMADAQTLSQKLREMEEAPCLTIQPGNLGMAHLLDLCCDTLACTRKRAEPLARLLVHKTAGNPFFTIQFLKNLYAEKLIRYTPPVNGKSGAWSWDDDVLLKADFTDNVVTLMVEKLHKLPDDTQQVLRLGATLGPRFELDFLAHVWQRKPGETVKAMFPAIREGLLIPISEAEDRDSAIYGARPHYRFLHDRVQQAAYALFEEEARQHAHHAVGLLLKNKGPTEDDTQTFAMVDHLNEARHLPEAEPIIPELITLNLLAGKKARQATAFTQTLHYLNTALELLERSGDPWEQSHQATLELFIGLAEGQYLTADFESAEGTLNRAHEKARTIFEKAEILDHKINMYTMNAQFGRVTKPGLSLLVELDVYIPQENPDRHLPERLVEIRNLQGNQTIADLAKTAETRDPQIRVTQRILASLMPTIFFSDQQYFACIVTAQVILSLRHGMSPYSTSGFTSLSGIVTGRLKSPMEGYEWAMVGLRLAERFSNMRAKSQACHILGTYNLHWHRPMGASLTYSDEGLRTGLESGSHQWAGYNGLGKIRALFALNRPLDQLEAEINDLVRRGKQTRNRTVLHRAFAISLGLHEIKEGQSTRRKKQIEVWLQEVRKHQDLQSLCEHYMTRTFTSCIFGRSEEALTHHEEVETLISYARGTVFAPLRNFYHSLALLDAATHANEMQRHQYMDQARENQKQLETWARRCPENYGNKHLLVEAELARLEGRREDAADTYERAATKANNMELFGECGLAYELAGRFWLGRSHPKVARVYIKEARQAYLLWGAMGKLTAFEKQFAHLLDEAPVKPHTTGRSMSTTASWELLSRLDMASVLKASRAISGQIVLDELLKKMMAIMLENAGAQKGMLLLLREGRWVIVAQGSLEEEPTTLQEIHMEACPDLCDSMITYAARSRQNLVLSNATTKGVFTSHPYVRENQPKSVLCMPILYHGQLTGMLYLENNLVESAFTPDRLEVLKLLSSQAAVALENAYLYANQEKRVTQRTAELQNAMYQLEQKHEELKQAQDRLVQAEKIAGLGTLTAGVAHELKNPLNFINNFALLTEDLVEELREILSDRLGEKALKEDDDLQDILETLSLNTSTIAKHGRMADQTIQSMVSLARDEASSRRTLEINAHVEHYLGMAFHDNKTKDVVEVIKDFHPEAGFVNMAAKDLGRVWINLINNALDAFNLKHRRGQTDMNQLTVRTLPGEGTVSIHIIDNALGMPESDRQRIFEPFFTTKPPGEGNIGLGLSICFDIVVKEHGGRIEVNSEEGQYTEFVVTLAAVDPEE